VGIAPSEGGSGTALAISDPGTGTEGDAVSAVSLANVSLPFIFQFYGVDYTQITVCSNGFVAMGITQDASFRNYHIPGAMGPAAMIAPFWDDLSTGTGSGIYTWFDAASHRFIIEWHQMKNGYQPSMNETFQVILYDPAYYPTSLGDGPIKIQYQTFNNVDSGTGNQEHGVYSTIGIQDQMHQNGLEYSFNNTYPPAARHLANGRCIYITNAPVYDIVPELSVEAIGVTDTNGNSVPEPGETIQLQIQLLNSGAADTELAVTTLSTFDPYVVVGTSESEFPSIPVGGTVFNQLPFTLSISPNCPGNHVVHLCLDIIAGPYLEQLNFSIIAEKPELSLESYYLNDLAANNNGIADPNEDFLLILNVTNLSPSDAVNINATLSSTQPEVTIGNPVQTKPRLHLDDKVQFVFPIHFGALAVGTSVPFSFAYTAENSVTGNIAININCGSGAANGSGVIQGTVTLSNAADPSPVLLTTAHHFFTYPATDGSYAFYFPIGSYSIAAALQYYFHEPIEPVMITDTNPDQQIDIAMAFLANPTCLTIVGEADESEAILTWVAPENPDYPVQIYRVYRKLNSGVYTVVAEPEGTTCVDALTEQGTYSYYVSAIYSQGEGAASEVQTLDFPFVSNPDEPGFIAVTTLQQNFPNPFNPTTTIAFSLAKPGTVNLKIYNTKGQLIKMLVSDFKAAGMHRITWNSVDSSGKPVSSGIYLYRLEAHNFSATRKMILIK
jgi:hypothetical protein